MYFKSILSTSPWLVLFAVCLFFLACYFMSTLTSISHAFSQLLAFVPGGHPRVISWSRQIKNFSSSGCSFGAVLLVPGSPRLHEAASRSCSYFKVMGTGYPHPKETINLPHTRHMQLCHFFSVAFVKLRTDNC